MTQSAQRELVVSKLTRLLGPAQAQRVVDDALAALGLDAIRSARDRLAVGQELARRSTALAPVGIAIAAQAEIHSPRGTAAESRAASELAHAHAIISASDHAIVGKTLDGTILSWNPGAERLYGYRASEAIGHSISMIVPADKREELAEALRQVGQGNRTEQLDTVRLRRGGERVDVALSLSPLLGPAGTIIGGSAITHEITERVCAQRERDEARRDLAEQARELRRSNKELEQFAHVVSHDLQEPLRMVASYTALLKKRYGGQLDDKADRYIGYAVDGAVRMQTMLSDLLALSQVGGLDAPLVSVPLDEVVTEVRTLLRLQLTGATLRVGELPTVEGDGDELVRVFQNIIANALKYRGEIAPAIDIRARRVGDMCEISIADNGIGFDDEQGALLFEPFQRLHARGEYEGSGIGLAIVAKIVARHGGRVWAQGIVGRGATFFFTLKPESV